VNTTVEKFRPVGFSLYQTLAISVVTVLIGYVGASVIIDRKRAADAQVVLREIAVSTARLAVEPDALQTDRDLSNHAWGRHRVTYGRTHQSRLLRVQVRREGASVVVTMTASLEPSISQQLGITEKFVAATAMARLEFAGGLTERKP
jgi:hypothetical protein